MKKFAIGLIAWKLFQNNVTMKENKFQFFIWCLTELARVIKRKLQYAVKRHWLPQLLQKFAQRGFCNMLNPNLPTPAIQALIYILSSPCHDNFAWIPCVVTWMKNSAY